MGVEVGVGAGVGVGVGYLEILHFQTTLCLLKLLDVVLFAEWNSGVVLHVLVRAARSLSGGVGCTADEDIDPSRTSAPTQRHTKKKDPPS